MNRRTIRRAGIAFGLLVGSMAPPCPAQQPPGLPPYPVDPALGANPAFQPDPTLGADPALGGGQVLARGPIHEAFAEPVAFNPAPGAVIPQPPPRTQIEEQPPDQRPQGADVEWVPGYWAWDDDRQGYIWISGIWRDIPPGRQWVPGYWGQVDGGFRWTSGFWGPLAANGRFDYLPPPPQSLEVGPNTPQPGDGFAWAPGSWVWVQDRYAWRPGYWVQAQPDWVWVPSSYVPTPSGYVYNDGYWDYPLATRGVQFAPMAFGPQVYAQPSYAYTPSYVLPAAGLLANLFIRPIRNRYYYGDYYGSSGLNRNSGYVPWFGYGQNRQRLRPVLCVDVGPERRPAGMGPGDSRRLPVPGRAPRGPAGGHLRRPARAGVGQRRGPRAEGRRRASGDGRRVGPAVRGLGRQPGFGPPLRARRPRIIGPNWPGARPNSARSSRAGPARSCRGGSRPRLRAEERRPQRLELPRSPIAAAQEPRFGARAWPGPPRPPRGTRRSGPTFDREPVHRPPGRCRDAPSPGSRIGAGPNPSPAVGPKPTRPQRAPGRGSKPRPRASRRPPR